MALEWRRDRYLISTDPALIDLGVVHSFLANDAYWSKGIRMDVVRRRLANCVAFGEGVEASGVGGMLPLTDSRRHYASRPNAGRLYAYLP